MEIDEQLQEDYGYPAITEADKRKILGENQARLFGVDIETSGFYLSFQILRIAVHFELYSW